MTEKLGLTEKLDMTEKLGMNEKDAMLEAHVRFEMERLHGDALAAAVQEEVAALYRSLADVPVNSVLTPPQLTAWLRLTVLERPLPPEAADFLHENLLVALETVQDDATPIEALIDKALYDRTVARVAEMEDLRRDLTHQLVSSTIYSRLIADVLYHGIKNFLLTENALAKNIPGASSLVRLGQSALSAAAPQLEKNVDKQLIAFIDANIQETVGQSEAFINRTLDAKLIHQIGEQLWHEHHTATVADVTGHLDRQAVTGSTDIVQEWWQTLNRSQLATDIVQGVVRSFFLRYGKQNVRSVLERFGLDETTAQQAALFALLPLADHPGVRAHVEARIRARLAAFYAAWFDNSEREHPTNGTPG